MSWEKIFSGKKKEKIAMFILAVFLFSFFLRWSLVIVLYPVYKIMLFGTTPAELPNLVNSIAIGLVVGFVELYGMVLVFKRFEKYVVSESDVDE